MGSHTVHWDADRRVIEFKLIGAISVEEMAAFGEDLKSAVRRAGMAPFNVLADLRQNALQSPEVAAIGEELMRYGAERGQRTTVILVKNKTMALQMQRLANGGTEGKAMTVTATHDPQEAMRLLTAPLGASLPQKASN